MKKLVVGLTVVTLLAIGAIAYAQGPGYWGGGHMMGPGYGGYMMGPGYGGHMMGSLEGYDQKFLDETADLRKELHNKRFAYFEAIRNPETDTNTITEIEKEIRDLQDKIYAKAPKTSYRSFGGYGCRW